MKITKEMTALTAAVAVLCVWLCIAMVDGAKAGAAESQSERDSTIKTRKASCRCGQLNVTYKGSDPERRTLCHCNSCQLRTGTAFSIQGRFPREKVKIEGKSAKWTFPNDSGKRVTYRSCDSGGATYHFCPVCGSTVYWDITAWKLSATHREPCEATPAPEGSAVLIDFLTWQP